MTSRGKLLSLFLATFLAIGLCITQTEAHPDRGPSTPEERALAVKVAKLLRSDPLSKDSKKEREWLVRWVIEVPDISVKICSSMMGDLGDSKKSDYPPALLAVMIASQAAFIIENPEKAKDDNAIYLAGVEGMLDGYGAIRARDSKYHAKQLDEFSQQRSDGKLPEAVASAAMKCNTKAK